jgi:hypothetical protein
MAERATALVSSRRQTVAAFEPSPAGATVHDDYEEALAADLPGGPRAGETLRLEGRTEFAFVDGRIAAVRSVS